MLHRPQPQRLTFTQHQRRTQFTLTGYLGSPSPRGYAPRLFRPSKPSRTGFTVHTHVVGLFSFSMQPSRRLSANDLNRTIWQALLHISCHMPLPQIWTGQALFFHISYLEASWQLMGFLRSSIVSELDTTAFLFPPKAITTFHFSVTAPAPVDGSHRRRGPELRGAFPSFLQETPPACPLASKNDPRHSLLTAPALPHLYLYLQRISFSPSSFCHLTSLLTWDRKSRPCGLPFSSDISRHTFVFYLPKPLP